MHFISPSEEWKWFNPDPWSFEPENDASLKKGIDFAKQRQEEKERNFAAYFKQQDEMKKEKMRGQAFFDKVNDKDDYHVLTEKSTEVLEKEMINEKAKNTPEKIISNDSDINQTKKIKEPIQKSEVITSFVVSRYPTFINELIQFIKEDGTCVFVSEKFMRNSSLPWTRRRIKLNVYKIENKEITDWGWSYFVPSSEEK